MLLTGATITDMSVIITPATEYKLPASVLADLEVEPCHIQISPLANCFRQSQTPNSAFA